MANTPASTVGGVDYDFLIRGSTRSYSSKLIDLIAIDQQPIQPLPFNEAKDLLVRQIDGIFADIAREQEEKEIEAFTIGKSHARRRRTAQHGFKHFDRKDLKTWKLDGGINGRWQTTYKEQGYDGLVALTAITREVIPSDVHQNSQNPEQYAIALEQSLIQHYSIDKPDPRLANKSSHPGKKCANNPYAGIVYVAYKLNDRPADSTQQASTGADAEREVTGELATLTLSETSGSS